MLRGIATYARAEGNWWLYHHERMLGEAVPTWLKRWRGDGIIARIEDKRLARYIGRMGLPTVDLRCSFELKGVPRISNDQEAIARLAADHFLERGFAHFAYCGLPGVDYSDQRGRYFVEYLAQRGYSASVHRGRHQRAGLSPYAIEARALNDETSLAAWINSLPKPVGVMTCNDSRAQHVVMACGLAGVAVPDEVAIIGAGNDETVCDMCNPPLSSVVPDSRKIGYSAAVLLDRMLHAESPPAETILVQPLGVVTRLSTDVVAIGDADVTAAVRLIRQHACEGIRVEDLLGSLQVSRSTLERRFYKYLGRSPKTEIFRVRLQRVRQLLAATDYSLSEIAQRTGFSHVSNMCHLFRQKTGQTRATTAGFFARRRPSRTTPLGEITFHR